MSSLLKPTNVRGSPIVKQNKPIVICIIAQRIRYLISCRFSVNPKTNLPQKEAYKPVGKRLGNIEPNFGEHLGVPDLIGGVGNEKKDDRIHGSSDEAIRGWRDAVS